MLKRLVLAVSLAILPALSAHASSDDAWADFAAEVEQACLTATDGMLKNATAVVDPFGSESFGLAIVNGEVGERQPASIICVFNKQTKAVEIGGELDIAVKANS